MTAPTSPAEDPTTTPQPVPAPARPDRRHDAVAPLSSRERMVRATGRLLRQQGFHATGLNQIVVESGAPKGSVYFHFPDGKVQLAAEAIELFGRRVTAFLTDLFARNPSPGTALAAYLDAVADAMERSDFEQGCAIATVALEAAAQEPRLGDACAASLEDWIDLVRSCLEAAGQRPDVARDRAVLAVAAFEGAFVLAKARRSVEPLHTVAEQLRVLIDAPTDLHSVAPQDAPSGTAPDASAVKQSRRSRSS